MKKKTMKPKEFITRLNQGEKFFALDVRSIEKIEAFQLKHGNLTTTNIEKGLFLDGTIESEHLDALPIDQEIVVICTTGNSAAKVAETLQEKGYDVTVLKGGIQSYLEPGSE